MRLVVSVSLVALYVAASAWVGWWVMEPINRSAGPFRGLRQFQIADVVSLMLLLQIALAISAGLIALNRESVNWPTFVLVVITVGPAFICGGS